MRAAHWWARPGQANLVSTAQIKEAQLKIQHRFQQVNDQLRSGANMYSNADDHNHQQIASIRARCAGPDARTHVEACLASLTERLEFS